MKSIILSVFIGIVTINVQAEPLKTGSKAPELQISEWVKNGPVKLADGKGEKTYIIEFWATWCPPCRRSIPHLSALQKKYKEKGLVVVGISREDLGTVKKFVATQEDMDYNVGVDTDGAAYKKYMEGVQGIPHAFVVDKQGIVVWSGHPMEVDNMLDGILDGTFDIDAGKKAADLQEQLQSDIQGNDMDAALKTAREILMITPDDERAMQVVQYIYQQKGEIQTAIAFIDQLITTHPAKSKPYTAKLELLKAVGDAEGIKTTAAQYIEQFNDNASKLNSIAWILLNDIPFSMRPLAEALGAAEKAVKLAPESDKVLHAAYMDTLARCYYAVGRLDKAVQSQSEAVALVKGTDEEQGLTATLKFYKEVSELGKKIE